MNVRCRFVAIIACCALCVSVTGAAPPGKKAPPPRHGRDTLTLNGDWKSRLNAGAAPGWERAVPEGATSMSVPSLSDPGGRTLWCWREFDVPAKWQGQTVRL